jgi:hypothetical protein
MAEAKEGPADSLAGLQVSMTSTGKPVSIAKKRVDLVLVDARPSEDRRRIAVARGYERRGDVWSDLLILDREAVLASVKRGKRVFVGTPLDLPGDFELQTPVRLSGERTSPALVSGTGKDETEGLGLPVF